MLLLTKGLWLASLIGLIVQDWKSRTVSVWGMALFMVVSFGLGYLQMEWKALAYNWALNTSFLLIQFGLLSLYFFIRKRKWQTLIDRQIGLGDILFFLAFATIAPFSQFIWLYVLSLIFSLFFALILRWQQGAKTIPLISSAGLFLVISKIWIWSGVGSKLVATIPTQIGKIW